MPSINYIVKSKKIVSASRTNGTILDGALVISDGAIKDIGPFSLIKERYRNLDILDFQDYIITPSLVDCHTHTLEYAPSAVLPVTEFTHFMGAIELLLDALSSGITSLGEQICGHPETNFRKTDYLQAIEKIPMDISFSISTVPIGFEQILFFTGITGSKPISQENISSDYIIDGLVKLSDYPGENIMINATPANLEENQVPRAGEIVYSWDQVKKIANTFHKAGKKVGAHVAGKIAIDMALDARFDILHHAHDISESQIERVRDDQVLVVATPLGGSHLAPNKAEEIVNMVSKDITLAISTDGYLPPSKKAPWLPFKDDELVGPSSLLLLANPSMVQLKNLGLEENEILKLITLNPAKVLGKDKKFGSLEIDKDANFIVSKGIPGLDITDPKDIVKVFFRGNKVIDKDI